VITLRHVCATFDHCEQIVVSQRPQHALAVDTVPFALKLFGHTPIPIGRKAEQYIFDQAQQAQVIVFLALVEEKKTSFAAGLAAFSDIHATIEDQIAEGDKAVTHWIWRGTHKGAWIGIPATHKTATVTWISIDRIVAGKIVQSWDQAGGLGFLQQIGAIPPLGEG
jgi:predicted ester cyclase